MSSPPIPDQLAGSRFMVFGIYFIFWSVTLKIIAFFPYENMALVDGLTGRSAFTDISRIGIGFLLTGIDALITLAFVSSLIHLARRGDQANLKVIQWIRHYWWFCVYGLARVTLVTYFLAMQYPGTFLTSEAYKGWSPLLNTLILSSYLLGTWWLSQREPEDLKRRGKIFLGPRAAHLLDR